MTGGQAPGMSTADAVHLVTMLRVACPQQRVEEGTETVWATMMTRARITRADAEEAIVELGLRTKWIAPSDVVEEVKRIRARRIDATPVSAIVHPIDTGDPDEYRRIAQARTREAADGRFLAALGANVRAIDGPRRTRRQGAPAPAGFRDLLPSPPLADDAPEPVRPPDRPAHDADTMARYERARQVLAARADHGAAPIAAAVAQAPDASPVDMSIRAAELAAGIPDTPAADAG